MSLYTIYKKSGTYSELLEAYGLINFIRRIFKSLNLLDYSITITDKEYCYEISTRPNIEEDIISELNYFPPFKYIKQKFDSDVSQYPDYYDYPTQNKWKKEQQDLLNKAYNIKDAKEKKQEIERINNIFENEKVRDLEYDVYSQIQSPNNFSVFDKMYANFHDNHDNFAIIVKNILNHYQGIESGLPKCINIKNKITALQLYNPNQGKGVKSLKANSVTSSNFNLPWISETMKISGALSDMACQLVKVGQKKYDLKIYVPEYKQLSYNDKSTLIRSLKKYTKGNTPIKIDILYILLLAKLLIEITGYSGQRRKIKDIVSGLHSVYQKNLGKNNAVVNIGFIQIPNFIEISSKDDVHDWIDILDEQRSIISKMDEEKGAYQGMVMYRNFISGSNLSDFFNFSFWYAEYLTNQLSKQNTPVFSYKTLNKLYESMDNKSLNLKAIIENDGFKAVADAIRKSTVSLQYLPKDQRSYEIRYGVAQALQTKSKTKEDFSEFIGEFIATYNAETSRKAEKDGKVFRKNVREDKLTLFYELLDQYSSSLIGALLASYGFALPSKSHTTTDEEDSFANDIEE